MPGRPIAANKMEDASGVREAEIPRVAGVPAASEDGSMGDQRRGDDDTDSNLTSSYPP